MDVKLMTPDVLNIVELEVRQDLPATKKKEWLEAQAKLLREAADATNDKYHFVVLAKEV